MNEWIYLGDVNPHYGGKWIRVYPDDLYADIIEVVDLDGAAGADGLIMITAKVVPYLADKCKVRGALSCFGKTAADLRGMGKDAILLLLADALDSYGYCDPANRYPDYHTEILVTRDYRGDKASWQGWERDFSKENSVRLHHEFDGDLSAYVKREWLD